MLLEGSLEYTTSAGVGEILNINLDNSWFQVHLNPIPPREGGWGRLVSKAIAF